MLNTLLSQNIEFGYFHNVTVLNFLFWYEFGTLLYHPPLPDPNNLCWHFKCSIFLFCFFCRLENYSCWAFYLRLLLS